MSRNKKDHFSSGKEMGSGADFGPGLTVQGTDVGGSVFIPMRMDDPQEMTIAPRRTSVYSPNGKVAVSLPSAMQLGLYRLNLPHMDNYVWRAIAMQIREQILGYNKKNNINFFDQYPEALLGGNAPASLYDVDAQVNALVDELRDYTNATMHLIGCMANEFILGKGRGSPVLARLASAFRINTTRGRYNRLNGIPIEPWLLKYVSENTRIAAGSDGGDMTGYFFPLWRTDLGGSRSLRMAGSFDPALAAEAEAGKPDLSLFAPMVGATQADCDDAKFTTLPLFKAGDLPSTDGYIADYTKRIGNQWIGYIANSNHIENFAPPAGPLTRVFRELGFLKGSLDIDAFKDDVLNNDLVKLTSITSQMIHHSREVGTWGERTNDWRKYVREGVSGYAYTLRSGYAPLHYLWPEMVFAGEETQHQTFPYAIRGYALGEGETDVELHDPNDMTPILNAYDDGPVDVVSGDSTEIDGYSAGAFNSWKATLGDKLLYGLSAETVEAMFNAEKVGDPMCFLSSGDIGLFDVCRTGEYSFNGDKAVLYYVRQVHKPLIDCSDPGQCGLWAIIDADDLTGMWSKFFTTLKSGESDSARCLMAGQTKYSKYHDMPVFLGDGFFLPPVLYFSRNGLSYGQWRNGVTEVHDLNVLAKPFSIEAPIDINAGTLRGFAKQARPDRAWDMGAYIDYAGLPLSTFYGYADNTLITFKQMEFEYRIRHYWFLGPLQANKLLSTADVGYNSAISALIPTQLTNYRNELERRFRQLEYHFKAPAQRIGADGPGDLPIPSSTNIQEPRGPRSTPNRTYHPSDKFGRKSGGGEPRRGFNPKPARSTAEIKDFTPLAGKSESADMAKPGADAPTEAYLSDDGLTVGGNGRKKPYKGGVEK